MTKRSSSSGSLSSWFWRSKSEGEHHERTKDHSRRETAPASTSASQTWPSSSEDLFWPEPCARDISADTECATSDHTAWEEVKEGLDAVDAWRLCYFRRAQRRRVVNAALRAWASAVQQRTGEDAGAVMQASALARSRNAARGGDRCPVSTLGLLRVHERMAAHAAKAFSAWRLAKTLRQHQHAVCAMEEGCRAVRAELEHQRELSMKERRMRETLEQPLRPPNVPPGSCNDDELVMLYEQLAYWKDAARRQHAEKRHVAQLLQESETIHGLTHGSMLMYQAETKRLLCHDATPATPRVARVLPSGGVAELVRSMSDVPSEAASEAASYEWVANPALNAHLGHQSERSEAEEDSESDSSSEAGSAASVITTEDKEPVQLPEGFWQEDISEASTSVYGHSRTTSTESAGSIMFSPANKHQRGGGALAPPWGAAEAGALPPAMTCDHGALNLTVRLKPGAPKPALAQAAVAAAAATAKAEPAKKKGHSRTLSTDATFPQAPKSQPQATVPVVKRNYLAVRNRTNH